MFWEIFLFEIKYRLKRPDTYLYFLFFFFITIVSFSTGEVPSYGATFFNSPQVLAKFFGALSIIMMVVTAAIMGVPLYRDIEYSTHEYYLSYPITKNGYFWGRFLGSFLFVLIIGSSMIWGSLIGTYIGPKLGWISAIHIGPYHFINYCQPFLSFVIPNLVLTSSIFFGLVAYTRNVKVIYTGATILYTGYMMALFIFQNLVENKNLVYIFDPFAFNPIDLKTSFFSPAEANSSIVSLTGMMLVNRIIWGSVGLLVLLITYFRFNFVRFFSGRKDKKSKGEPVVNAPGFLKKIPVARTRFTGDYNTRVIYTLSKIELRTILNDNYFRLILGTGIFFLCFIFWKAGGRSYGVPYLPRTVILLDFYNNKFLLFIFLIILFYTGETVNREKTTRFAIINDALPPSNWILYGSKLVALACLVLILATTPLLIGVSIQLLKGFRDFNFPLYFEYSYLVSLPLFLQVIMFCFVIHVLINNKFAAHAIALLIWVGLLLSRKYSGINYNLFYYSYTPSYQLTDMDGIRHMAKPLFWFIIYWMFLGGIFVIIAAIFYSRGTLSSFKERCQLASKRFERQHRLVAGLLLLGFMATGFYNYYNVSYINNYLSDSEIEKRKVEYEIKLKQYEKLPKPKVVKLKLFTDIFPEERKVLVKGLITIVNKTNQPINDMLLDGEEIADYSLTYNGVNLSFASPLIYKRGKYNWLRPKNDTAEFRLYHFPGKLQPGDTALIEINAVTAYPGFTNNFSGGDLLYNGTFFGTGLPGLGYDEDDELWDNDKRGEYHLPEKNYEFPARNDSAGIRSLLSSDIADLVSLDITVSTSADQVAIAPGELEKKWKQNGRNYYHYVQDNPPVNFPFGILSARYALLSDSVQQPNGKNVNIEFYYYPLHTTNLNRFMAAYKDGIKYFSAAFGPFQFKQIYFLEYPGSWFSTQTFINIVAFSEQAGWAADFTNPDQFDYCYFVIANSLAHKWWGTQVTPNHTLGSFIISGGLPEYAALLLIEKNMAWRV